MHNKDQTSNMHFAMITYKLASINQFLHSAKVLDDETIEYILKIAKLRTNKEQKSILHLAATDKSIEQQTFIDAANVLNTLTQGALLTHFATNNYSVLCSALSMNLALQDDVLQNAKKSRLDSILFLISKGSSCLHVIKFENLHDNLALALKYKDAFFYAIANALFESYTKGEKFEATFAKFKKSADSLHYIYSGAKSKNVLEDISKIYVQSDKISSVGILHFLCRMIRNNNTESDLLSQLMISFINTKSIDINAQDSRGMTALHVAAIHGNLTVANHLLLNQKIQKNMLDSMGHTALFRSLLSLDADVVSFFIKAGYNINAVDKYGFSVLHRAVTRNCPDMVRVLLENGANVDTSNEHNRSPITTAIEERVAHSIVGMLKEYSEDLTFHTNLARPNERYKISCCSVV